jgi:hypothetical protein
MSGARFEWDEAKDKVNQAKHQVSFNNAQWAFADPQRVIARDLEHSRHEPRFYCFGKVGGGVLTVHLAQRCHSHIRRRLLAQRQGNL